MKRQINFWFICRFTMLCIILEERRKMRKKILDAAMLTAFAVCLSVTSNIQESADYENLQENESSLLEVLCRSNLCDFRKFIYDRIR